MSDRNRHGYKYMNNFWQSLPTPFFVQAPMENVSDVVFREVLSQVGAPDVYFTEFTSTDGLCSQGLDRVSHRLKFLPDQKPIVAQIWGKDPQKYFESAKMLVSMGFLGIDINMGCPDRAVLKGGSCAALIQHPSLAAEIIHATKEGAGILPVSVKTRIGYNTIQTEKWIGFLLEQSLAALTVHGRTVKEQSLVPAHWDEIAKAVVLRNQINPDTFVIGNGDVLSREQAEERITQTNVDGVMIGRGMFHNLWIFNKERDFETISTKEKLQCLAKHILLYDATWGEQKPFHVMKKYFKIYISGFPDASEMRAKLMVCETPTDALAFLSKQIEKSE